MTFRQKRSNGGYGLRRKVMKKRLDEDFEYNFSKAVSFTKSPQPQLGLTVKHNRPSSKVDLPQNSQVKMEIKGLHNMKKQRGRPKKIQIEIVNDNDESLKSLDSTFKFVQLKGKKTNKPTVLYIEPPVDSIYTTMEEICGVDEQGTMSVSHEEVVDNTVDLMWKKIKVEALAEVNDNEQSSSEEERVEKENLPDHRIDLVGDLELEDGIIMELNVHDSHEDLSEDMSYEEDPAVVSRKGIKRKFRQKFEDQLQGLKHLNSEHKIECTECHKLLKPSSFRQHLRTHTGEKPFCCVICDARFTRKGDVERHVRIVHNKQKPFKCGRCQRAFGDKKNLRWHLMNHDKKLFYICETCGFKFGKREYWENHVRFIHPLPGGLDPSEVRVGCDEEEFRELDACTTESLTDTTVVATDDSSQAVETAILSIQDKDVTSDLMGTFPTTYQVINHDASKFVSVNGIDFCNYIKLEGFQSSDYQPEIQETDSVVIEFDQEDDPHLDLATQQPFKQFTELVNANNVLHVVDAHNTDENQDLPIIIDSQDLVGTSDRGDEIESRIIEAEMVRCGQVITGILLDESEALDGDISNSSHSFINAFIDVVNTTNDEGEMTDEVLVTQEQC